MTRLQTLEPQNLDPEVQTIFSEIEQNFGGIPNLFKTYAHYPPLLRANWYKMKATMEQGQLSPRLKQTIALLVSQDNSTEYCIQAHSQILMNMGMSNIELTEIRNGNLEKVGFDQKQIKLVDLMRQVNQDHNNVPTSAFDQVKAAGVTDAELVEAYGVMETFVGFNKFLDSLEVELD
ncbi:MAG: carboxymuconolactone decarboxylase family protein [Spirulinaceae cyanobacterium]